MAGLSSTLDILIKARDRSEAAFKSADTRVGRLSKSMSGFGVKMGIAGAAVTGFAALSVMKFAKVGDEVQKVSLRTGLSANMLSKLRFAAQQSGTELNGLERGMFAMQRQLLAAELGLKSARDGFRLLNLDIRAFRKLGADEQFLALAIALQQIENLPRRGGISNLIFGRFGRQLLPMIAEGAGSLESLIEEGEKLNITFSKEEADKAAFFVDSMNSLKRSFEGVQFALAIGVIPQLTTFLVKSSEVIAKVSTWAKANPELAKTLLFVGIAVGLALSGLALLTVAMALLIPSAILVARIFWGIVKVLISVASFIVAFVKHPIAMLQRAFAAIRGFVGLAILAFRIFLVSVGDFVGKFIGFIGRLLEPLARFWRFLDLKIFRALLNFRIFLLGARATLIIFGTAIGGVILAFAGWILIVIALIAYGVWLIKNWKEVRKGLGELWAELTNFGAIIDSWNALVDVVKRIFGSIVRVIRNNWDIILAILFPPVGLPLLIYRRWSSIVDMVKIIFDKVKGVVTGTVTFITDKIKALIDLIKKIPTPSIPGGGFLKSIFESVIPEFHRGVRNFAGGLAMVGERGPELVSLPRGSNVYPNSQLAGAGGSPNVNVRVFLDGREIASRVTVVMGSNAINQEQLLGQ